MKHKNILLYVGLIGLSLLYAVVLSMFAFLYMRDANVCVVGYCLVKTPQVSGLTEPPMPTPTPILLDRYKLYELVNAYRVENGLKALVFDPIMCPFAEKRVQQIQTDWSHNGFDPEVKNAYWYTYAAENLARGFESEQEVVASWLASPGHRENIEKPVYTRTCIVTDPSHYVVQQFASF